MAIMDGSSAEAWQVGRAGGATPAVVIVGRSNYRKPSHLIARLATDLSARGAPIFLFETEDEKTGRFIDARLGPRLSAFNAGRAGLAGLFRKLLRTSVLLAHPSRWGYLLYLREGRRPGSIRRLRAFLEEAGASDVYLIGHSAGSVLAAAIEDEASVRGQISFGHPFRHPKHGEEAYRTAPLATRRKPLLVIQGARDIYGNAAAAARYPLSPAVRLVSFDTTHDFEDVGEADYAAILALVADFTGLCDDAAPAILQATA